MRAFREELGAVSTRLLTSRLSSFSLEKIVARDDLTEIVCILDRSGSMDEIKDDAIGGFNSFLEEQRKVPGEAGVTLMLFDNEFMMAYDGQALADVPALTETTYVPRGSTALYDAIGRTVNHVEARIRSMSEDDKPSKVLVVILTDGMENASKEFNKGRVQKIIKDHETKGWEFLYLKAGPDAFDEARMIGMSARNYANISASGAGLRAAYGGTSDIATAYRAGGQSAIKSMSLQASVDSASDNSETSVNAVLKKALGSAGLVKVEDSSNDNQEEK